MKVLSLFANIGVAEAYLRELGVDVAVANELLERRAKLYAEIYPETEMIPGDITTDDVFSKVIRKSREAGVKCIMATPPCQGMSTAGQLDEDDERNRLIIPVINAVHKIKPDYVFIENVPNFFNTTIKIDDQDILIPDYIDNELENEYIIHRYVINTKDYSVPQVRERAITLLTRRTVEKEWMQYQDGTFHHIM